MGEHGVAALKRHNLESDPSTMIANLLRIETTEALRQFIQNTLDQRRFAGTGTTRNQNFLAYAEQSHQKLCSNSSARLLFSFKRAFVPNGLPR
jgi:hypothetical protein